MTARRYLVAAGAALALTSSSSASLLFIFTDASGLSAEAEFSVTGATELTIRLKNTSTGVPDGFSNSDQLLTAVSWDFGVPGFNGDITITGGTVFTGPDSASINFDIMNVGPNTNVSGEWGFGNTDGTGLLPNLVSTIEAQATPFLGLTLNLDGPIELNGPQGGLVANPELVPLGGLGAIQDEVIITVSLSGAITEAELLADLLANGTLIEFGSDQAFLVGAFIPSPGALALLVLAGALAGRRQKRR